MRLPKGVCDPGVIVPACVRAPGVLASGVRAPGVPVRCRDASACLRTAALSST